MTELCLCQEDLKRLIEVELEGRTLYEDDEDDHMFQCLHDEWRNWQIGFVGLATCLSQILEQKLKQGINAQSILEWIYSFPETTGLRFTIEGFADDFVAYMLLYPRQDDVSLEECLVEIRNCLSEYTYPTPH